VSALLSAWHTDLETVSQDRYGLPPDDEL
jgi:hypothetical protein